MEYFIVRAENLLEHAKATTCHIKNTLRVKNQVSMIQLGHFLENSLLKLSQTYKREAIIESLWKLTEHLME